MADEGTLCQKLREFEEGRLALDLGDLLYLKNFEDRDNKLLRRIESYLLQVARQKAKATFPSWVRDLFNGKLEEA